LRDERQCADWSIRYDLIMLAHGVEKLFYHQGASGEVNYGSANVEFPLLGEQGKPLKLYAAQAIAAGILGPKPVPAGELQKPAKVNARPTTGVYGYAFQCGPRAVLAAWCVEGQAAAEPWLLRAPEDVEASDLMGNRLPAGPVGLGGSPVYLTSTARPARELAEVCGLTGQGGSAGSPQP
jgi:hypothetical protein